MIAYKLSVIFKSDVHACLVKTRVKDERVILIRNDKFYNRLATLEIKKKNNDHLPLSYFL